MIRILSLFTVAILLVGNGWAGAQEKEKGGTEEPEKKEEEKKVDKIGRLKAPAVALKAAQNMTKLKGVLFSETFGVGRLRATVEGEMKKDFCKMTGNSEVYNRRNVTLVKDKGGRYVPPDKVVGEQEKRDTMARSPVTFYNAIAASARSAEWTGDEEDLDGFECRVLKCQADNKLIRAQIQEYAHLGRGVREMDFFNLADFIDYKESASTYLIWVGKHDLRIHKIIWNLDPVTDQDAVPPIRQAELSLRGAAIAVEYTLTFREHDEEPEIEIPAVIKAKLKVR